MKQPRDIGLPSDSLVIREHASLLMPILDSFFRMLPVLTLDLIPEFFELDGYNQDWLTNGKKYFLCNIINQSRNVN